MVILSQAIRFFFLVCVYMEDLPCSWLYIKYIVCKFIPITVSFNLKHKITPILVYSNLIPDDPEKILKFTDK